MADKIVEIPNIGQVAFPATMSDDEIIRAIQSLQAPAAAPAMPPDTMARQAGLAVRKADAT
jgi:hypothetical protein